jgi:hypothetical protein
VNATKKTVISSENLELNFDFERNGKVRPLWNVAKCKVCKDSLIF